MKPLINFVTSIALAATCNAVSARGQPDGGNVVGSSVLGYVAQVAIIDRRTGIELVPYFYRGEYWVAGTPGATYSISIRNRLDRRLLAVTSVDGVNVLSGATASWDQTGYVFDPQQRYEITGWRKSDSEVAAFTFTASPNSYAERTGRPANVGVIGVALFRERQPELTYLPPVEPVPAPTVEPNEALASNRPSAAPTLPAPAPAAADEAPAANGELSAQNIPSRSAQSLMRPDAKSLDARAPKLGTGHGQREYSYVSHTDFIRLQPEPNEIIRIRYDSYDNLVAMGVIKRPRPTLAPLNPFPGSPLQQYVPDPPDASAGAR